MMNNTKPYYERCAHGIIKPHKRGKDEHKSEGVCFLFEGEWG
jgi:hypothetical protein